MRASEIDTEQAKDLADREMLETIYSALITADPTPLNPNPAAGMIAQVAEIRVEQERVATALAEHRAKVKDLLDQHAESDAVQFQAIREVLERLEANGTE